MRRHLAAHEGDLRCKRQVLGAHVVAAEQRHAAEDAVVVADELVEVGVGARVARVEPEARDLVQPHGADEVLAHARGAAGRDAAAALDAAVELVDLLGEVGVHALLDAREVDFPLLARAPRSRGARSCARIHLPVFTDRSPISSKTGSGASVISAPRFLVSVRQASAGRPLITIAQLPQMPARQTKSNCSDGSCFSRISFNAMKRVMPVGFLEVVGLHPRDRGRVLRVVAQDAEAQGARL